MKYIFIHVNIYLFCAILGPLASLIANMWSCRVCMMTGGLVASISHVVTAFMPEISYVIISLGIFGGNMCLYLLFVSRICNFDNLFSKMMKKKYS